MTITILSHSQILQHWSVISALLEKAIDQNCGEAKLEDYLRKVLNDQAQLWAIIDGDNITGAGVTEVLTYSKQKVFHIFLFAGIDFELQSQVFPIVEAFAKDCGCIAIEQWGRKGWAKTLPKYVPGFREVYTVMRKEL
jgi:hypothetical protein